MESRAENKPPNSHIAPISLARPLSRILPSNRISRRELSREKISTRKISADQKFCSTGKNFLCRSSQRARRRPRPLGQLPHWHCTLAACRRAEYAGTACPTAKLFRYGRPTGWSNAEWGGRLLGLARQNGGESAHTGEVKSAQIVAQRRPSGRRMRIDIST